jgi:diguanylate cyclase (GGDEF)-like protein
MNKQADAKAQAELQRDLELEVGRLDRKVFDLLSLLQANKAFDDVLEAAELHNIFTSIVNERFGAKSFALFVMDEEKRRFLLKRGFGLPEDIDPDFSFPWSEGLLWQAMLQGRPFSVIDSSGEPRFRVLFEKFNLNELGAELFLPLTHQGDVVGFLAVGGKADGSRYSDPDLEFLRILSSHAAVSFKTTMLYEKSQRDRVELDKTVKNLSMLYNISASLIHISDLKQLLKTILGEAINTTDAQKGSLMLYDSTSKRLVLRVVKGLPDPRDEEAINNGQRACTSFAVGEGVAGKVFQTQKAIIVNAAEKDSRYETREGSNVDSILCLPLVAADEPIGVINITNKKDGRKFNHDDVELLTALSNQAAVAINNVTLYEMAITDELTKIYIRRYFNIRLTSELKRAQRYGKPVTVAICDLDKFKLVNDNFGHDVGDNTLITVADVLRTSVRDIDTAARYGGEEFAIIFPETGLEGAKVVAERVREAIGQAEIPGLPQKVTVSIGLACYPQHGADRGDLLRAADSALYEAKRTGRNRVCIYDGQEKAPETESSES